MLIAHISIALASIIYASYLYFRPSQRKLYVSAGLVAATLASGTYLVASTHSPLLPSCFSGLIYLWVVTILMYAAYRKFAEARAS